MKYEIVLLVFQMVGNTQLDLAQFNLMRESAVPVENCSHFETTTAKDKRVFNDVTGQYEFHTWVCKPKNV